MTPRRLLAVALLVSLAALAAGFRAVAGAIVATEDARE